MAELTYIASGLLTGLFLVGLVVALARARQWKSYTQAVSGPGRGESALAMFSEMARTPLAWTVAFLLLVFGAGAGAIAFVTGPSLPPVVSQGAGVGIAAVSLSLLGVYLFWGVYHSARYRGLKSAQAAAVGLWLFGILLVAAIVLQLVTAG